MTTEDTTTKEEKLDLWRKCPYLTIDEAMNLILYHVPPKYRFLYAEESEMPPGAVLIYRTLVKAISDFKLCIYLYDIKITGQDSFQTLYDLYQHLVTCEDFYQNTWWHNGKIATEDLKTWLKDEGFSSKFFEIKPASMPACMNSDLEEHSYKLAAAVKAWEHFYTNGLTYPKKSLKKNIEIWLTEHAEPLKLLHNKKANKQAIEEIAKIVNWKPEGGAPKS